MTEPVKDTQSMIGGMEPCLLPGEYAFVVWPEGKDWPAGTFASCQEPEGLSLVVPLIASTDGSISMRCITLQVHSSLEGVGLTAAVSNALAQSGIPANMIAGYHHDHVFVPSDMALQAMNILKDLQKDTTE